MAIVSLCDGFDFGVFLGDTRTRGEDKLWDVKDNFIIDAFDQVFIEQKEKGIKLTFIVMDN